MEDKQVNLGDFFFSVKRIECLLEELIFQHSLSRTSNIDEANEKFNLALENVNRSLESQIVFLPKSTQIPKKQG